VSAGCCDDEPELRRKLCLGVIRAGDREATAGPDRVVNEEHTFSRQSLDYKENMCQVFKF
jgi:hypothetical protein